MAVSVEYGVKLTVKETITAGVDASAQQPVVEMTPAYATATFDGTSAVPATKAARFDQAVATTATLDLTALTGVNGAAVTFNTLKVQVAKFKAPTANTQDVVVTVGATNGYLLAGTAWKFTLKPGQEVTLFGNEAAPDVGAASKTIDLSTASGSQVVQVTLVAG